MRRCMCIHTLRNCNTMALPITVCIPESMPPPLAVHIYSCIAMYA